MADPIEIRLSVPVAAMAEAFEAAPDIVVQELAAGVAEASMLLEREVRERTPTSGAGTLRDSIGAIPVTWAGDRVEGGVSTASSYAAPVETGSKPHMPPAAPIVDWVARKLGKRGEEGESIAQAIRWKIFHHGTPAHHMFELGLAAADPQIREILAAAGVRALERGAAP